MKDLTDRQLQVLQFIQDYTEKNVCPPTVREIADYFGISLKAVQDHIAALRKKGFLSQSEKRSRSLRVLRDSRPDGTGKRIVDVPLLGTIAAGTPIFADENTEKILHLPDNLLAANNTYFALHVRGDSMINAGILNGDIAVIRQCETASDGEIVAALIDDSATLKRFFKEASRIRLQPENDDYRPIYSQNVRILGVLASIIRSY